MQEGKKAVRVTDINLDKAFNLYQKAAASGDSLAQNYLGSFYFNHKQDYEKAVRLFRQASASGKCERALNNLGMCFEQGIADAV